jgi:hypothetical protein
LSHSTKALTSSQHLDNWTFQFPEL